MDTIAAPRDFSVQIDDFQSDGNAIVEALSQNLHGQRQVIHELLVTVLSGGHVLLEGAPGLGKTTVVKNFAQIIGAQFNRVQCTPDLMPSDILGTEVLNSRNNQGTDADFRFVPGPVFTEMLLVDEINRAPPRSQAALLEVMEERQVTQSGQRFVIPEPFRVFATQNMIDMHGTYPLPEAQLDRFGSKIIVPFPDRHALAMMSASTADNAQLISAPVCSSARLIELTKTTKRVHVPDHIIQSAIDLVLLSHPTNEDSPTIVKECVAFGASPRALIAILDQAKVEALLEGRPYVETSDVRNVACRVLRHRLFLSLASGLADQDVEGVLEEILETWSV